MRENAAKVRLGLRARLEALLELHEVAAQRGDLVLQQGALVVGVLHRRLRNRSALLRVGEASPQPLEFSR